MTTEKSPFPLCAALLLAACDNDTVLLTRWHKAGMSERDIARQQRMCSSQADHDAKKGKQPKPLEQCTDEAGYYRTLPAV